MLVVSGLLLVVLITWLCMVTVDYKEAYALLYWLEDHAQIAAMHQGLYLKTKEVLEDDHLDKMEAIEMRSLLYEALKTLK